MCIMALNRGRLLCCNFQRFLAYMNLAYTRLQWWLSLMLSSWRGLSELSLRCAFSRIFHRCLRHGKRQKNLEFFFLSKKYVAYAFLRQINLSGVGFYKQWKLCLKRPDAISELGIRKALLWHQRLLIECAMLSIRSTVQRLQRFWPSKW